MDHIDTKILSILQEDTTVPVSEVARRVGLSTSPCWRRIQRLEADGVIRGRVALLDPDSVNVGVTVFVALKTNQHNDDWFKRLNAAVRDIPEIVEFHRMSGEIDYLMRVVVPDIVAYDAIYKELIRRVDLSDVTSMFAMECIKSTTALPLSYAEASARGAHRP